MAYRWIGNPADWLNDRIDSAKGGKFAETDLAIMCRKLASKLSADDLQDLFQDEMDADGYFKEEDFETYRSEAWGADPEDFA